MKFILLSMFLVLSKENSVDKKQNIYITGSILDKEMGISQDSSYREKAIKFKFEDSTLVQTAEIQYITPLKIKFLLKTYNIRSQQSCEYSNFASMDIDVGSSAQYEDEENQYLMYDVNEFFMSTEPFLTIGIDRENKNRLVVNGTKKMVSKICSEECSLLSNGTLRRKD